MSLDKSALLNEIEEIARKENRYIYALDSYMDLVELAIEKAFVLGRQNMESIKRSEFLEDLTSIALQELKQSLNSQQDKTHEVRRHSIGAGDSLPASAEGFKHGDKTADTSQGTKEMDAMQPTSSETCNQGKDGEASQEPSQPDEEMKE